MRNKYHYTVEGTGADNQTWTATGDVESEFEDMFDRAMMDSFTQLTHGKAVYGKPGVGCNGPYDIVSVTIKKVAP